MSREEQLSAFEHELRLDRSDQGFAELLAARDDEETPARRRLRTSPPASAGSKARSTRSWPFEAEPELLDRLDPNRGSARGTSGETRRERQLSDRGRRRGDSELLRVTLLRQLRRDRVKDARRARGLAQDRADLVLLDGTCPGRPDPRSSRSSPARPELGDRADRRLARRGARAARRSSGGFLPSVQPASSCWRRSSASRYGPRPAD